MQLGNLTLIKEIGRGGMASVWLAEHKVDCSHFAVKIMHPSLAQDHNAHHRFLNEVRAISQLNHPNIIKLYDYGLVSSDPDHSSLQSLIPSGTPYCVMEYHPYGTYKPQGIVQNWYQLTSIVGQIIKASSVIHAEGITHCDLKPSNILHSDRGPIISDFGIIYDQRQYQAAKEVQGSHRKISGTPSYMPPEQILSHYQSVGPWTDLYSIACIAYYFSVGHPPYNSPLEITRIFQHLNDPLPSVKPLFSVPKGFEAWIHWCMNKTPKSRPRFAAEALKAFQSLSLSQVHSTMNGLSERSPSINDSLTYEGGERPANLNPLNIYTLFGREALLRRILPIIGQAGFQLDFEQRVSQLHTLQSQLLFVTGESGVGKSSLLNRALAKLHQAGTGEGLKLTHEAHYSDYSGISGMLRQLWDTVGQSREEVIACLQEGKSRRTYVQPDDLLSMVSWVKTTLEFPDYAKRTARISAFSRWVYDRSMTYPQVILIDDAQWAHESLVWAHHYLTNYADSPVLIVMCAHDRNEIIEQFVRIEELCRDDRCAETQINKLSKPEAQRLFDSYFPLHEDVQRELFKKEKGHPLRSLQRMRYWMNNKSIHLMSGRWQWAQRNSSQNSDSSSSFLGWSFQDPNGVYALEVAALIGQNFLGDLWFRLCTSLGYEQDQHCLSLLISKGVLSHLDDHYLHFIDYEEHQALIRQAERLGRAQHYHHLIAEALEQDSFSHPAIRLQHWIAAKEYERIGHTAAELVHFAIRTDQYEFLNEGFKAWVHSLRKRQVRRISSEWLLLKLAWAERCIVLGHNSLGRRHAFSIVKRLRLSEPSVTLFHALLQCTQAQKWDLELSQETIGLCHEALIIARELQDQELETQCLDRLGVFYHTYGQLDAARDYFNQALSLSPQSSSQKLQATIHLGVARLCVESDLLIEADQHCQYALDCLTEHEYQALKGSVLLTAGDIARQQKRFDDALLHYEEAIRLLKALGAPEVWAAYINLALTGYEHKDWVSAAKMIDESRSAARRVGADNVLKMIDSCSLFGLAKLSLWEDFDHTLSDLLQLHDHRYAQYDSANTLEQLAFALTEDQQQARAQQIWLLTALQFEALGLTERAHIAQAFYQTSTA